MNNTRLKSPRVWKFQSQLLSIFAVVVLCLALSGAFTNSWLASRRIVEQLLHEGSQVTDSFARQSILALLYGLGENARDAARTTLGFPGVRHVALYDKNGVNLLMQGDDTDWIPELSGVTAGREPAHETGRAWHFVTSVYDSATDDELSSPFEINRVERQFIGYVHVVLDKSGLQALRRSVFLDNFLSTFVFAVILLGLLQWLTARITRPLNDLASLMKRAEQGDVDVRSSLGGSREMLNMSQAFNKMMSVLGERTTKLDQQNTKLLQEMKERRQVEQQLIEYRDHLQDMVDEQTRDLIEARDAALVAERAMSAFLANMSHELRTPLHGILSFASFGMNKLDRVTKEKLLQYFQEIHDSGSRLLRLLNDLLDLSKLRAGKMTYDYREADIGNTVHTVLNEFQSLLEEKSITVAYDEPEISRAVTMDESRIAQVIRNLVSNAVKFSPEQSRIDIGVEYAADRSVVVSVADQGVGIPEDELENVFSPFTQSSNTQTNAGGTGLGLPICKEIVEGGHRGWIRAEIGEQGGTKMAFGIPVAGMVGEGAMEKPWDKTDTSSR